MKYKSEKIDIKLKTMPGWYFFYMPLKVPYGKLANLEPDAMKKGIYERGKMFGRGWIGVESKDGDKTIKGTFKSVIHKGAYKKLGQTYKQIMRDNKGSKEFYNVYLNSPMNVDEKDLKTKIIFK